LFNWLSTKAQDLIAGTPVEAATATATATATK
jgi:hypothetical protein